MVAAAEEDIRKTSGSYLLLLFVAVLTVVSCKSDYRTRPYGYHRLGKLSELMAPETELTENNILLRRDNRGFYAMSTACTYDLTYLQRRKIDGKDLYVSTYTESKYDLDGKVVSGPSKRNLPYYELRIAPGIYDGPRDTLYVYVGKEVSPDYRLPLQ